MRLPASLAARGSALFLALGLGGATAPAGALDVLEGLAPGDFRSPALATAEARASAGRRLAWDRVKPVDANPLGSTAGGMTLTELGVGSGATELAVSGSTAPELLGAQTAEERRILGTLAALAAIDGLTSEGGILDVEELLGELDEIVDLPGGLLGDLLGGGDGGLVLEVPGLIVIGGGEGGLLGGTLTLVGGSAGEVGEILEELPDGLPISLPGLLP